jgi:putative DNA primase/helicase
MASPTNNPILDAALGYAARGWSVFPCAAGGKNSKRPLVKGKRKGEGGLKLATTNAAQIREWWSNWPGALIGVPTGENVGAFVIDCDPRNGESADQVLRRLQHFAGDKLPPGPVSQTQSGGLHLWFRYPEDAAVKNRAGLVEHVDVRGEGGYVIVPPSTMASGKTYVWEQSPGVEDLPECPPSLLDKILRRCTSTRTSHSSRRNGGAPSTTTETTSEAEEAAVRKYGAAALVAQIGKVATAAKGQRNQLLNNAALALGQLVAAGAITEYAVCSELEEAARQSGVLQDDGVNQVRDTIASGMTAGLREPSDLTKVRARARRRAERSFQANPPTSSHNESGASKPPVETSDLDQQLAQFPLTDLGNAERFRERQRGKFLWCPAIGWLWWDGRRWARDGATERLKIAEHETVRSIQDEAMAIRSTDGDYEYKIPNRGDPVMLSDALAAWGRASEAANRLAVISKRAAAYLAVSPGELDADPWCFNLANGTLCIAKKQDDSNYITFRRHDPDDLITKISPVTYNPAAECPIYDRFLNRVQPSVENQRFLHQWHGSSLTGEVSDQKLAVFWGKGKNGKSTLVDLLA